MNEGRTRSTRIVDFISWLLRRIDKQIDTNRASGRHERERRGAGFRWQVSQTHVDKFKSSGRNGCVDARGGAQCNTNTLCGHRGLLAPG